MIAAIDAAVPFMMFGSREKRSPARNVIHVSEASSLAGHSNCDSTFASMPPPATRERRT